MLEPGRLHGWRCQTQCAEPRRLQRPALLLGKGERDSWPARVTATLSTIRAESPARSQATLRTYMLSQRGLLSSAEGLIYIVPAGLRDSRSILGLE